MFEFITDEEERGQVGIGTLIVFIAMVLVAAIAAGVLINTAGFLQETSQETGEQSTNQVSNGLVVKSATGQVVSADFSDDNTTNPDNHVGALHLIVKGTSGAGAINLADATVQIIGPRGETVAGYVGASSDNSTSGSGNDISANQTLFELGDQIGDGPYHNGDSDDAITVLDQNTDRANLILVLNQEEPTGGAGNDNVAPGRAFDAGEEITLRITTADGATTTLVVNVPNTLTNGEYVDI